LVFMSCFALGLLSIRIIHLTTPVEGQLLNDLQKGSFHFLFLAWNLALAWIPLLISHYLSQKPRSKWIVSISVFCWLLFFPNAPYLITDFVHLQVRTGIPLWYDILLLFTYAILGLALGIRSLEQLRQYLHHHWGHRLAHLLVGTTLLLSGLGIYLGRVLRWNSWDAIVNPWGPIQDTLQLLMNPIENWQAWLMITGFSLALSTYYWVMQSGKT